MKTAIVYDRVNKWGGAEKVLLVLNRLFPKAPLYTALYEPKNADWVKVFPKVVPSFLNSVSMFRKRHEMLAPLMPLAFESFDFDEYDLVISVTSEAAKGIITKPHTKHICYCLTPTRYLWSRYDEYFRSKFFRTITKPSVDYLRKWDKIASWRPDVMVAISKAVQKRIKKYYGHSSEIIFPPVDVDRYLGSRKKKDYYLVVSRLVPYKKVDLVIEAFNQLDLPLKIVGTGSEEKHLRTMAKSNIEFTGFVEDGQLPRLYQEAKAFIFPQDEDFGIAAVEAQAAGTPVIAYKKGGALDTVIEGKTGVFFDKQDVNSLISSVRKLEHIKFKGEVFLRNVGRFSEDRFKREFNFLSEKLLGR